MIKYEIILYWSDEDECFMAEVPELPGCAADGPSARSAGSRRNGHPGVDRDVPGIETAGPEAEGAAAFGVSEGPRH
jgi:hypothetical protein